MKSGQSLDSRFEYQVLIEGEDSCFQFGHEDAKVILSGRHPGISMIIVNGKGSSNRLACPGSLVFVYYPSEVKNTLGSTFHLEQGKTLPLSVSVRHGYL